LRFGRIITHRPDEVFGVRQLFFAAFRPQFLLSATFKAQTFLSHQASAVRFLRRNVVSILLVDALVTTIHTQAARVGPNGGIFVELHTHAGQVGHNGFHKLTKEELAHISSLSIGSAKQINNPDLKSNRNVVSPYDVIPFLADPAALFMAFFGFGGNTTFAKPSRPLLDHAHSSEPYQRELGKFHDNFNRKYPRPQ